MTILKLSSIRLDGNTQARESLNQETVREYAERMREGDKFPAIDVFFDGSAYWLADGFHRYFATKSHGAVDIECTIHDGPAREARLFAISANDKHGIRPSLADRKHACRMLLADEEWSQWSDSEISRRSGLARPTVVKVRSELSGGEEAPRVRKYIDSEGKENEMLIPKKVDPKVDIPEVKAEQPKPEEDTRDMNHDEKDQQIMEMADLIESLTKENDRLRDVIAVGQWDASDIEKMDAEEVMKELRERIRVMEIELDSVKSSRDTYQMQNAEMLRTIKAMRSKLKKLGAE